MGGLCEGSAAQSPCRWIPLPPTPTPTLSSSPGGLWEMFLCTPGWVAQGFLEFTADPKAAEQVSRPRGDPRHAPPQLEQIAALSAFRRRRLQLHLCGGHAPRTAGVGECHRREE